MPDAMDLALFDLDNTLLEGDSDHAWAAFLIEEGVIDRATYEARNNAFYEQYKAGTLDIREYLRFALGTIAGRDPAVLAAWRDRFLEIKIRPMVRERALELIQSHDGALKAIVTATNSFITRPIADLFGISNLIACEAEQVDGRYTGEPQGLPSFREGKVTRVEAWLAEQSLALDSFGRSFFYSDSANDLALMQRVSDPVAVDPDPTLATHAARSGWPIVSLKRP